MTKSDAGTNVVDACTFAGFVYRDGVKLPYLAGASVQPNAACNGGRGKGSQ